MKLTIVALKKTINSNLCLILIILTAIYLRFYLLDNLPGEIFGDIYANLDDVKNILSCHFPVFAPANTGREVMLFYLVAITAHLSKLNYLSLKITTALIGISTIPPLYLFTKNLFDKKTAIFSSFILATSSWHIVFSRLGFRTILTPLFVILTLHSFLRALKSKKNIDFAIAGTMLGFGMYTYTAFRIMPFIMLIILIWQILVKSKIQKLLPKYGIYTAFFILILLPLAIYIVKNPASYWSHSSQMFNKVKSLDILIKLIVNIKNQSLMFFTRGDVVFRVNPVRKPLIDILSSTFFIVGLLIILVRKKIEYLQFILLPFIMLNLPSIFVLNYPDDIPSATRSTGIIPFVSIIVAVGIITVFKYIKKYSKIIASVFLVSSLFLIFYTNYVNYFNNYADGLPNHNIAFSRKIAEKIDKLPNNVSVFIYSCCWGEWGQPEPKGIKYALSKPKDIVFINQSANFSLENISKQNYYFIIDPRKLDFIKTLQQSLPNGSLKEEYSPFKDLIYLTYTDLL